MSKDLTNSPIDRQNILNNNYALVEVEKAIGIKGIPFEGGTVVLKEQVADFLEVTTRTVDKYLERFGAELAGNGDEVIRGKRLQGLKLRISESDVHETDFVNIKKVPQMGVFPFRAFLNLAMVVAESERARLLRRLVLDIVIDTINQRTGGRTKYINQRDEEFLQSAFIEENYRKLFTDALRDCVDMGNFKYAVYTDRIYVCIFREKSKAYRDVLKLETKDCVRVQWRRNAWSARCWKTGECARAHSERRLLPNLRQEVDAPVFLRLQVPLLRRREQTHRDHALRTNAVVERLSRFRQSIHLRGGKHQLPRSVRQYRQRASRRLDVSSTDGPGRRRITQAAHLQCDFGY